VAERTQAPADSSFSPSAFERTLDRGPPMRWMGWRLRLLVFAALVGSIGVFTLMRWLAASPYLDAVLQPTPQGALVMMSSPQPALEAHGGHNVVAFTGADGRRTPIDALLLERSPRWQVDDGDRERQVEQHERFAAALADGSVELEFGDGSTASAATPPRGYAAIGLVFWPLTALALVLYLLGIVVVLVRPQLRNLLYAVIAFAQAGNLLFIAVGSARGVGLPAGAAAADLLPRLAFDLVSAAAVLHAFALHPRRLPAARLVGAAAWTLCMLTLVLVRTGMLSDAWWWGQAVVLLLGCASIGVVSWSYRIEPNPFAAVMRRFGAITVGTLALVTVAVAVVAGRPGVPHQIGIVGSVIWYLFLASLLLLVPFLSRSKQVLREFAMLAGISTVATSLDLLFVAVFSFGQFTSLTLAVFLALGLYAGARQWILNQMIGSSLLTTERTFEQLYRVAREVQERPSRYVPLLEQLLRDLFDPLEVSRIERAAPDARVVGSGSALVVPVRHGGGDRAPLSIALRFARRGKRLFTTEDARLADRVVQQLRRAVAYDQAVERGRNEERLRIAQDLHDDIGARLLTLMYKAQSPEMEDYVRHTLLDLKTLTRGLAAAEHRLSHASAEWKADLTQRLNAAQVQLGWAVEYDHDVRLSVVQWSALTRVLRELVSNALYHANASSVDVTLSLVGRRLALAVADDGNGRNPQGWSHGLGLGGVRKRVKLLGGEVRWRENVPRGIVCEVLVADFPTIPIDAAPARSVADRGANSS
jgi:signal transduction histidine kinase